MGSALGVVGKSSFLMDDSTLDTAGEEVDEAERRWLMYAVASLL